MATSANVVFWLVSVNILFDKTHGYYCDNDKCLEEEFCCGENICCVSYKVWELWYFWIGILIGMLLLSLCACFWRERSRAYWVFRSPAPYSPMTTESENKYVPSHSDKYTSASDLPSGLGVGGGGSFYNGSKNKHPQSWYTAHSGHQEAPPPYSDGDTG